MNQKILPIVSSWFLTAFLVASLVGFTDAAYLTIKYYNNLSVSCGILGGNCERVTASQYATVGDIPVALLGAFYYFVLFVLILLYLKFSREGIIDLTARLTLVGFLVSLWLLYLQLFVIKAVCLYCLISALSSTVLFVLGLWYLRIKGRNKGLN